jgi:hypothetical protein
MKDAKGHGSDPRNAGGTPLTKQFGPGEMAAHQTMVRKVLASGDVHGALAHAVTGYDRKEQARAEVKGSYYNPNVLGIYLGGAQRAAESIKKGASHADAINNEFNGGLARSLHKALGTGGTDVDTMRKRSFK